MISDRFINAFKTSLACLIGFLLSYTFHFPSGQWVIITIIVVMAAQMHFGGALQKAYLRFLGTIVGASLASLTLLFFKSENSIFIDSIIIASVFIFSYVGGRSSTAGQAASLGAVTVAIILLSPQANLHYAYLRTIEILLGIFIALMVNVLIFPIHAKRKLQKKLEENMDILQNYYDATLLYDEKKGHTYEQTLMENFMMCHTLLEEAAREPGVNKKYYLNLLLHQKRLFRAMTLLDYTHAYPVMNKFIMQELAILVKLLSKEKG